MTATRARAWPWVGLVLLGGCGGAAQQPEPASPAHAAPSSVVDTAPAAPSLGPAGSPPASPPPPPPPPPAVVPPPADQPDDREALRASARVELERAQRDLEAAASECESACRALASMDRATIHLCALADQTDDRRRCDDARKRLSDARVRVRAACGTCP
jgi:hypothetical protein